VLLTVLIGHFWFQVPLKGNLLLLLGSSFIFLTGAMGIGEFISTNARSSQEAMMIALILSMLPTLLLSGFIFPIENMPWALRGLSYLIPARYFLKIVRGVFLKGVGLNYLWKDELMMLLFSLVILGASARSFKKRIT
jgi:ABC-2 type transport system permease protein